MAPTTTRSWASTRWPSTTTIPAGTSRERCWTNFFNRQAYEKLPKEYQRILDAASYENFSWVLAGFDANNGAALQRLITKHNVNLVRFPDAVMKDLRKMADEVVAEQAAKTPMATKVNNDFQKFRAQVGVWHQVSEKAYYNTIAEEFKLKK